MYTEHGTSRAMHTCHACHRSMPEINRFCTQCGQRLDASAGVPSAARPSTPTPEQLNINVLYGMVAVLALAIVFPPWETPPDQRAEFLGLHLILSPPTPEAIVSRMLLTIELVTIGMAGLYGSWLFRRRR